MRRGRNRSAAAGEAVKCRMCGRAVAVGRDGRCPLGHFVGVPPPDAVGDPAATAGDPAAAAGRADDGDPGAAPAPGRASEPGPATVPLPAVGHAGAPPAAEPDPAAPAVAAAPQPPAGPAPQAAPSSSPPPVSEAMFADVSSLDDLGSVDDLRPYPDLVATGGEDLDGLVDIGAYGELVGLDDLDAFGDLGRIRDFGGDAAACSIDQAGTADLFADLGGHAAAAAPAHALQTPDPSPSAPARPRSRTPGERPEPPGIDDLLGWDASASALDADLPAPPAEPVGADAGEETADETTIVEDEAALEAEDRRIARRRALGILGGTIVAAATVVGSILALPL